MLGSKAGSRRTTQQIAEQTQVPSGYLSKVLQALGRAGVVEAQRGLYGGFVLARPLNELTILDVINAIDPLERIERCPLGLAEHGDRLCPLHRHIDQGIAEMDALQGNDDRPTARRAGREPTLVCDGGPWQTAYPLLTRTTWSPTDLSPRSSFTPVARLSPSLAQPYQTSVLQPPEGEVAIMITNGRGKFAISPGSSCSPDLFSCAP